MLTSQALYRSTCFMRLGVALQFSTRHTTQDGSWDCALNTHYHPTDKACRQRDYCQGISVHTVVPQGCGFVYSSSYLSKCTQRCPLVALPPCQCRSPEDPSRCSPSMVQLQ